MIFIQGLTSTRQKDKFVPLPNGSSNALNLLALDEGVEAPLTASDDNYLPSHYGRPGTAFSAHKPGSAELLRQANMDTLSHTPDNTYCTLIRFKAETVGKMAQK